MSHLEAQISNTGVWMTLTLSFLPPILRHNLWSHWSTVGQEWAVIMYHYKPIHLLHETMICGFWEGCPVLVLSLKSVDQMQRSTLIIVVFLDDSYTATLLPIAIANIYSRKTQGLRMRPLKSWLSWTTCMCTWEWKRDKYNLQLGFCKGIGLLSFSST